jgi:hypothetical protein
MNISPQERGMAIRSQILSRIPAATPNDIRESPPPRTVELTAAQKADIAETERRTAGGAEKAMAMVAQARAAEANVSRGGGGVSLQVGDISKLTDREAQGALAVAEKLQSLSGWRKMTATVSNNSETTLSLDALRTCCAKGSAWRAAIRRTPRPERSSIFPPRRSVSCRDGRSCSPLGLDKATSMTASSATNTRWAVLAYLVH